MGSQFERNCFLCACYKEQYRRISILEYEDISYCMKTKKRFKEEENNQKAFRFEPHECCYVSVTKVVELDPEFEKCKNDPVKILELYEKKYEKK